jgi:uncharacterized protein (TIGR03790 family)
LQRSFLVLLGLFLLACARAEPGQMPPVAASRVLVVANTRSPDSVAIASYYQEKRRVPAGNLCRIACPVTEECAMKEYKEQIEAPIKAFLDKSRLDVDFILLTKGIPIRTKEGPLGGFGTDSMLTLLDWTLVKDRSRNPYFGKEGRFSRKRYSFYLVTRLDGYSREECFQLVDNALAARPLRGPFLLDIAGNRQADKNYRVGNDWIRNANELLLKKGFQTRFDKGPDFIGGQNLMGYYSWGSNDSSFNQKVYNGLTFAPGALAETVVSTSGRTFSDPNAKGQSRIADLIRQGVTGCKGYVSEPYLAAMARPEILFDRYTSGYTLAESFYAASPFLHWKDVVIGDPLCAPYARE